MTARPAIRTRGLTKRFGSMTAVDGIDLTVPTGSVVGLIGPNGAGKSTTMRMLLDVIRPSSGRIEVLGCSPRTGGAALRRRIGYLPGEPALPPGSGRTVLHYLATLSGTVPRDRIGQLAERLGVDPSRPVGKLSKGNKQKVAIIQAFMHSPELLILDEPTSGLDPLVQREFLRLVREARERGATVLLSSHVLTEIEHVADTASVLRAGRIVAEATVEQLRRSAVRSVRARVHGVSCEDVLAALPAPLRTLRAETTEDGVLLTGDVEGEADLLVKTLGRFTLSDLSVTPRDLETSVLSMYDEEQTR